MRRFTCTEGGSSKFWEAAVAGDTLTVRFGKLGTDGQTKAKDFADAAAADRELAKLIKEKTGKGYVEAKASGKVAPAKAAPAKAGKAAPAKVDKAPAKAGKPAPAIKLGPYLDCLVAQIRTGRKRKKPHPDIVPLLAKKKLAADLRAFLEAVNEHELGYIHVGEYWLEEPGLASRVPDPDDDDKDRDDVFCVGNSPGGDLWVVDNDATGKKAWVTRIIHDEGWTDGEGHEGFEELLTELTTAAWDDDNDTTLDAALAKRGIKKS